MSEQPGKAPRWMEYMPITALKPAKSNPKDHDIGALSESVDEFGYVEPMSLDERTGRLVSGHGRLETLVKLRAKGDRPPRGILVKDGEWMVPVNRGWRSKNDAHARAYVIASNRVQERGGWLEPVLGEQLKDLALSGRLVGTGYDGDDVEAMLRKLSTEPKPSPAAPPPPEPTPQGFEVIVTLPTEKERAKLLEQLARGGYQARPQ